MAPHRNLCLCRLMLEAGLRDLIGEWLERRPPDSPWLFPTRHGTQVSPRYMREMVKRTPRKAGVQEAERISLHTLRHTFATDLYAETTNLRLVQKALGHADISTTQIYTRVHDETLEAEMRGQAAAMAT